MFPDQHLINNPYKIMLAQGEWTCTVADFRGTMTGPMTMPGGTVIQPTNKSFRVDFCTVAHWNEQGQIVEENLFYGHAEANRRDVVPRAKGGVRRAIRRWSRGCQRCSLATGMLRFSACEDDVRKFFDFFPYCGVRSRAHTRCPVRFTAGDGD